MNTFFPIYDPPEYGILEVIELKRSMGAPPAMASAVEIKLYGLELDLLLEFADGSLEKKTELYEQTLPYMPGMVQFR